MPARIELSDDRIAEALFLSRNSVSVAARSLGVATRTLQRRLKANPALWSQPIDHKWEMAKLMAFEIQDTAEELLLWRNVTPWSRYQRLVNWSEEDIEGDPLVLDTGEAVLFISEFMDPRSVKFRCTP